jgi:hypothetical protein
MQGSGCVHSRQNRITCRSCGTARMDGESGAARHRRRPRPSARFECVWEFAFFKRRFKNPPPTAPDGRFLQGPRAGVHRPLLKKPLRCGTSRCAYKASNILSADRSALAGVACDRLSSKPSARAERYNTIWEIRCSCHEVSASTDGSNPCARHRRC